MTNPPFACTVNNPILFKQWQPLIVGNSATFKAQTTIYPSSWTIQIYDYNNNYVNGATGTTTDGNISWTWNLRDSQGNLRDNVETDPYFAPYVTVSQQSAGITAQSVVERAAPLTSLDYPYNGGWIIAYQDNFGFYPAAQTASLTMFTSLRGGPSAAGLSSAGRILYYGNTNSANMTSDPVQNMIKRNGSWDDLRAHLQQPLFRNLYLFAHGSGFGMGGDWDNLTNDASGGTYPDGSAYDPHIYQTTNGPIYSTTELKSGWCYQFSPTFSDAPHPYRFVFLDGCETATGDWPRPFGIEPSVQPIAYYTDTNRVPHTRPSAFVGWKQKISYSSTLNAPVEGWGDYQTFCNFRSEWMFNWQANAQSSTLIQALRLARSNSNWIDLSRFNSIMALYGYQDLGFNQYNQRSSWP